MSQGDRDTVWHKGAPAELGARAGAQKKTNPSGLTGAAAPQAAYAYESLRAAVLCVEPTACPGLGILIRQGVGACMSTLVQQPHAKVNGPIPSTSTELNLPQV